MNLSLILFLIGIFGFVLNRRNIILMLISIEIMLLAITFLILVSSFSFDDILGQTFAIYVIAIAGAESAIGLGILVAFYRLYSSLISGCLSLSLKTSSKNNFNSSSHYPSFIYFSKRIAWRGYPRSQSSSTTTTTPETNKRKVISYSTKAFNNEKVKTSVLGLKGSTLVPL
jgi:NADH-ubiquinone oxidoreductase chain 4L